MPGAVLLAGLFAASVASAQTPATVIPYSGNGQLICLGCFASLSASFQTITAQVLDANAKPVAGTTVNWAITGGGLGGQLLSAQTTTDANGMASNAYVPAYTTGSAALTFFQTTIVATAGSASGSFTLTQALPNPYNGYNGEVVVYDVSQLLSQHPELGPAQTLTASSISGQLGTSYSPPIKVRVLDINGSPIPNVSLSLYSLQPATSGPTVQCGGSNAINGAVLTDSTGLATCTPVFGGTPGTGRFDVLVGAVTSTAGDPTLVPNSMGLWNLGLTVTPGAPGSFTLVTGNNQSAQAGAAVSSPLVVQVLSTGSAPLSGQTVTWSVSPSGSATLGSTSTTTDSNGKVSNTLTFASTASGTVTVTARLSGSSLAAVTFTETAVPNLTITGLSIVSGNGQAAIIGSAFPLPLVVRLSASNGTPTGIPVQFSVSPAGGVTLSSTTATTDSTGAAQVTVTAGSTAQNVSVTATASGQSATFNLTVSPPGPTLTASGFINAADRQLSSLSPCSLATIVAAGVAPGLQNTVFGSSSIGPLPTTLSGDQVSFGGIAAPIVSLGMNSAGQQQITFQVPCETTPGSSVSVSVAVGAGSASIGVPVQTASPGIFTTLLADNTIHATIVRPDGTFVTLQNPARRGEAVTAFVTGLGPSIPAVGTGALPAPGVIASPQYQVVVGMAGGGVPLIGAQLSPDRVGVWMVTFQIPAGVTTGNSVPFSISVIPTGASAPISSGTTSIPVQ
jgi:uncharacterized protein (TIGR03437 family)